MNYDLKTDFDRLGDRSLTTLKGQLNVAFLMAVIITCGFTSSLLLQSYIHSFSKTTEQARAPFQKLEGVPEWHLTIK